MLEDSLCHGGTADIAEADKEDRDGLLLRSHLAWRVYQDLIYKESRFKKKEPRVCLKRREKKKVVGSARLASRYP